MLLDEKAEDVIDAQQIKVGKATIITSPYKGIIPMQEKKRFVQVEIRQEDYDNAVVNIQNAKIDGKLYGKGVTTIIQKVYEDLLCEGNTAIPVLVDKTTFEGNPYIVIVNKNVVGKIMSDGAVYAEKLAALENVESVILEAKYLGSANYDNHNNKKGKAIRYDYFETSVKINGQDYIVKFDVEVIPGQNKYRTHKVINEMNLARATDVDNKMPTSEVRSNGVETVNRTAAPSGLLGSSVNIISCSAEKVKENERG